MSAERPARPQRTCRRSDCLDAAPADRRPVPVVEPEWAEPSRELVELARAYGVAVRVLGPVRWVPPDRSRDDHRRCSPPWRWTSAPRMRSGRAVRAAQRPVAADAAPRCSSPAPGSDNQCWVHVPMGTRCTMWVDREAGRRGVVPGPDRPLGGAPARRRGSWSGRRRSPYRATCPWAGTRMWARSQGADGVVAGAVLPAGRDPADAGTARVGRRSAVGVHDPGVRDAFARAPGGRRPGRPGRARRLERPCPGRGLRAGQPDACRLAGRLRWSPRPTCR